MRLLVFTLPRRNSENREREGRLKPWFETGEMTLGWWWTHKTSASYCVHCSWSQGPGEVGPVPNPDKGNINIDGLSKEISPIIISIKLGGPGWPPTQPE